MNVKTNFYVDKAWRENIENLMIRRSFCISEGGMPGKPKGRIGDAPLVGCGGYANEFGAATTSGHGEALMRMTLAREIVYDMEKLGLDAQVRF
jgi:isoaspartyl peptidase/L-asparaginase-like protein (Ntn-hydrolase superfamily)